MTLDLQACQAPRHGGNLGYAQARFGTPLLRWQDLSTGISPWSYPVPEVPAEVWQRLPGDLAPLLNAAANYYGVAADKLLALPGSQYAIQRFAQDLPAGRVAIPNPGYREHGQSWRAVGHQCYEYQTLVQLQALVSTGVVDHAVVINPNNPTTEAIDPNQLAGLHDQLSGYLLIDEAFVDYRRSLSATHLLKYCPRLFILRSLGKFFGLAGLRLGFLLGTGSPRQALEDKLDDWVINHPALWIGTRALKDCCWHTAQRARITAHAQQLEQQLNQVLGKGFEVYSAGLFTTLSGARKPLYQLYCYLARQGLFTRWCYETGDEELTGEPVDAAAETVPAWLRIGLPPDNGERLGQALVKLVAAQK